MNPDHPINQLRLQVLADHPDHTKDYAIGHRMSVVLRWYEALEAEVFAPNPEIERIRAVMRDRWPGAEQ